MPENPNKNILSKDVEIKGNIKFTNELVIDGKIEGEISSDGVLTVGENADIRGEIKTKSVTVLGKVNGNITVGERCELKARAHLVGDLKAARLVIEEGATFVGKSEVTSNKNSLPKTPGCLRAGARGASTRARARVRRRPLIVAAGCAVRHHGRRGGSPERRRVTCRGGVQLVRLLLREAVIPRVQTHCENHGSLSALQCGAAGTGTGQIHLLPTVQPVFRHHARLLAGAAPVPPVAGRRSASGHPRPAYRPGAARRSSPGTGRLAAGGFGAVRDCSAASRSSGLPIASSAVGARGQQHGTSSTCKACGAYIDLQDYKINGSFSRNIKTRGTVYLGSKGDLSSSKVICDEATIHGKMRGNLHCAGPVTIRVQGGSTARWRRASRRGERIGGACSPARQGHVPGGSRTHERTDHVRQPRDGLQEGLLDGDVDATGFAVEKGGFFQGELTINPRRASG